MDKVKLTVLGSGTVTPSVTRAASSFLLEIGEEKILLDCGYGAAVNLLKAGVDYNSIQTIFISHFHPDHFGDLPILIHERWMQDMEGKGKIRVIGPRSLKKRWQMLRWVMWPEPNEKYPIDFFEGPRKLKINNINIETFPIAHVQWFESVGIKLEFEGKTVVYTGDIGSRHPMDQLEKYIKNVDLLIIEAGYPKLTPNHFTIEQIMVLKDSCNIKKVIASHLRDKDLPLLKEKIGSREDIVLAEDLLEIDI